MKRGPLLLLGGGLLFLVLAGATYALRARRSGTGPVTIAAREDLPRAPADVRIRVQGINTTRTRGLARRATRLRRAQGFDGGEVGPAGPLLDTTLVLDRSGHPAWASSVAKVLGPVARTEARPDSSRYLDVTVLLGRSWRAPAEPLDP